jgi:hypothetical protein
MRSGMGVLAGAWVLAWAAASALPAQTQKVQVAPQAVTQADKFVRPQAFQETLPPTSSPLNVKECHNLGGKIDFAEGVCPSGYLCKTVDNAGVEHRVCLSKSE